MQKAIWPIIFVALAAVACTQAPADKPISSAPERFVLVTPDIPSVKGLYQFDLAFDTQTGRICRPWEWTLAGDTALHEFPECHEMLREEGSELQKQIRELRPNPSQ